MIPRAITVPFRWWTEHPWIVFWGVILFYCVSAILLVLLMGPIPPRPGTLLERFVVFVSISLLPVVFILSFSRGVFITWQRSKVRAVFAVVLFVISAVFITKPTMWGPVGGHRSDSLVKSNLKNAATSQEAYYREKGTYTANVDNLTGFNQSDNVTITVGTTAVKFVITGTAKEGCKTNTGTWYIDSTTGDIDGTPCR